MKALSNCHTPIRQGQHKRLSNIICVHMVHGFHAQVRQLRLFAAGKPGKDLRIEVAGRIQWLPARTDDMAWMQDRAREATEPGLA